MWMWIINLIAGIILAIGGINWGLVGIFNFNLIDSIFGVMSALSIIVYCLVLASTIWLIISASINRGQLNFVCKDTQKKDKI